MQWSGNHLQASQFHNHSLTILGARKLYPLFVLPGLVILGWKYLLPKQKHFPKVFQRPVFFFWPTIPLLWFCLFAQLFLYLFIYLYIVYYYILEIQSGLSFNLPLFCEPSWFFYWNWFVHLFLQPNESAEMGCWWISLDLGQHCSENKRSQCRPALMVHSIIVKAVLPGCSLWAWLYILKGYYYVNPGFSQNHISVLSLFSQGSPLLPFVFILQVY